MSGWEKRNASTNQAYPWRKLEKNLEDGNSRSVCGKDAWKNKNVKLRGTGEGNHERSMVSKYMSPDSAVT